jgi:hypothetical protein
VSSTASPSASPTHDESDEEKYEKIKEWLEKYWGHGKWFHKGRRQIL